MTKKIVKRTDANNETLYFYTHSDAVDVGDGNNTTSLTNALNNKANTSDVQALSDDALRKSPQSLSSQEKAQVHNNLSTESFIDDRAVRYDDAQVLGSEEKTQALTNLGLNGVDDEPTPNSDNLVKSGGVKNELVLGAVYDVSAKNPTAGPNNDGKFESLSALLSDANLITLIPTAVRKGGMSIKFVQSSDNKYVQARCMAQNFTTDVTQWQGVDDVPTAGSENFIKSGGIYNSLINGIYKSNQVEIAYNAVGKYVSAINESTDGEILSYPSLSIAYFPVISGNSYNIHVQKTTNNAGWELSYASVANGSTPVDVVLTNYGKGTWNEGNYTIVSAFTGYLVIGYATDTDIPVVIENSHLNGLEYLNNEIAKKVEYEKEYSKNLINPAEIQLNTYIGYSNSTGFNPNTVVPNSVQGGACSGFIPVTPGKTYYLTRGFSSSNSAFVFTGADKKPLSATPALDPETGETLPWVDGTHKPYINNSRAYKAPEGAVYALICLAFSGWTDTEEQIVGFQFEEGDTPTEYEPYYVREIIPNEHLSEKIAELPDKVEDLQEQIDDIVGGTTKTFVYNQERDAVSYIEGKFGDSVIKNNFKVLRSVGRSGGISECFNFETFTINGVNVHSATDDICPISFGGNGGYLGANHGCDAFYNCVSNSHGKTYADIGAEYSDGSHSFIIMDIIDENNIILANLDSSRQYPGWEKGGVPTVATYTWVSGGTNRSSFTVSSTTMAQGKPLEKLDETKVFVDGTEVSTSGTYSFKDKVVISQNYLIANPKSVWDIVKQNVGTFTSHPDYPNLTGVDYCVKLNISYIFTDAAHCFVAQTLIYLQDQLLNNFGFIQVGTIEGTSNKLYIPKALTVENIDFRTNPSYNAADATVIRYISTDYWENQNFPPDRFIYNNTNIAFNGGFLFDYGVGGENLKTHISNAFYLPTFRKVYIYGVGRMADDSRYRQSAGSHYSAVAFRIYKPGSDVGNGLFMNNCFEYDNKFYIYLDFNGTGLYTVNIPEKFIGKTVTLFEKSDNVELLTPVTSDSILIKVTTASPMYGYLVGQIK